MKVVCDHCERIETEPVFNWLQVGTYGIGMREPGEPNPNVRVCSRQCLIAHFTVEADNCAPYPDTKARPA